MHRLLQPKSIYGQTLDYGVDVDERGPDGRTALEVAARKYAESQQSRSQEGQPEAWHEITQVLLAAGAEYDIRSACYLGDVDRVQALAELPGHAHDKIAMRAAATYGHSQIVSVLLVNGADPEDAGHRGLPVSHFAIAHPEVLKLLFAAGADPRVSLRVANGYTEYYYRKHRSRSPLPFVISSDRDIYRNGQAVTERTYLVWLIGTYKQVHRRDIPLVPPEDYLPPKLLEKYREAMAATDAPEP